MVDYCKKYVEYFSFVLPTFGAHSEYHVGEKKNNQKIDVFFTIIVKLSPLRYETTKSAPLSLPTQLPSHCGWHPCICVHCTSSSRHPPHCAEWPCAPTVCAWDLAWQAETERDQRDAGGRLAGPEIARRVQHGRYCFRSGFSATVPCCCESLHADVAIAALRFVCGCVVVIYAHVPCPRAAFLVSNSEKETMHYIQWATYIYLHLFTFIYIYFIYLLGCPPDSFSEKPC